MWSLLVALAFVLQAGVAMGKVYKISESWNCVNNASLQEFPAHVGSYRLVTSTLESGKQRLLLSGKGTFGLAFLNLGTGRYYLSVMIATPFQKNSNVARAAPVWTANRNVPVTENSVLANSAGGLSLLDNGSVAWSSPKQKISGLSLDESGNLKLLGSSGNVVWQSFDHPADVLLPGQRLVTGTRLISSMNSTSMSEGLYANAAEASGVVLYYKSQPYFLLSQSTKAGLRTAYLSTVLQECPGFQTVMSFTPSGEVTMHYEPTSPGSTSQPCSDLKVNVGLPVAGALAFLHLEYDGNLNFYRLDDSGQWKVELQLTQFLGGPCQLPLSCGSYGICRSSQSGSQCECLGRDPTTPATINTTSASATCSKPSWASLEKCSDRYETKFVSLPGGSYFANEYFSPDRVSSALEDCLESCSLNCSCAALFYESNLRQCYFQREILGSLVMDVRPGKQFTAFLKYHNYSNLLPLPSEESNQKMVIGLISGAASTAVLLACCVLLLFYYRSRKALADAELIKLLTTMDGPPHKFSYRSLVAATRGFSKQLGAGGFGSVYEGVFHDGRKVAVKKLHSEKQGQMRQFISEVASLGTINHINIVKLCGYYADSSHRLLVYEYMPNGSLDKWIFEKSDSPLSWSLRNSIALGIARGLAYLHDESREPILHLDIKPQNILLDDNFVAKVADFGMARLLLSRQVSQVVTGVRGTPGYLAPEWLLQYAATKKCDVYSYGMVLLELIGGRRNLDLGRLDSNDGSWFLPAWAVNELRKGSTLNIVDPRIREQAIQVEVERLVRVAFWCIQQNQSDRPTMTAVIQMLEGEQDIPEPPMSFYFAVQATGILNITASEECTAMTSFTAH